MTTFEIVYVERNPRNLCEILKVYKAQWLSWLERRPVTAEVAGSSPAWVVAWKQAEMQIWDLSSAGRASALQAEGHRFEPYRSHFKLGVRFLPMWLNWQSS